MLFQGTRAAVEGAGADVKQVEGLKEMEEEEERKGWCRGRGRGGGEKV